MTPDASAPPRPRTLALVLVLMASVARAAVLRYPGGIPCNTTLQACIDGASAGDTVEVATITPIDEDLTLDKSLTLTAANGFTPLVGGGTTTRALNLQDGGDSNGNAMAVRRLAFSNAELFVSLLAGSNHTVEVSDCRISHAINSVDARGIGVTMTVPATVVIRNTTLTTTGRPISVFTRLDAGDASITLLGNVVSGASHGLSGSGIDLEYRGAGTVNTDVYSNVVYNVAGCDCNGASGIDVRSTDSVNATVNIVNNTLDNAKAIQVGFAVGTSTLLVNVFNNIVTRASGTQVKFPNLSPRLTINNGFNDLVNPDGGVGNFGGYQPGPSTYNLDPLFAGASTGNYRLRASSPVIDLGTVTPTGDLPLEDADRNARVAHAGVDMGAYEYGSSRPVTTTTTTTSTSITPLPTTSTTTTVTLPDTSCGLPAPVFSSLACRLDRLSATAEVAVPAGSLHDRLLPLLAKAAAQTDQARDFVTQGKTPAFRGAVRRAVRALALFEARLRSGQARRLIRQDQRDALRRLSVEIRHDLSVLAHA